jgi:hypothetical protein
VFLFWLMFLFGLRDLLIVYLFAYDLCVFFLYLVDCIYCGGHGVCGLYTLHAFFFFFSVIRIYTGANFTGSTFFALSGVFSHVQFGRSEFWKRRKYFCWVLRSAPTRRRARRTGTSARGFGRYMLHWLRTSTGRYHGTLVVGVIHVVSSSILVYSTSAPLYVQQFMAGHGIALAPIFSSQTTLSSHTMHCHQFASVRHDSFLFLCRTRCFCRTRALVVCFKSCSLTQTTQLI